MESQVVFSPFDLVLMKIFVHVASVIMGKYQSLSLFGGFVRNWISMCYRKSPKYDPFDVNAVEMAIKNGDFDESLFCGDLDVLVNNKTDPKNIGINVLTSMGLCILDSKVLAKYSCVGVIGHGFSVKEPLSGRIFKIDFVRFPTSSAFLDFDVNGLYYSHFGLKVFKSLTVSSMMPMPETMEVDMEYKQATLQFFKNTVKMEDAIMSLIEKKECNFVYNLPALRSCSQEGIKDETIDMIAYRIVKMVFEKGYTIRNIPFFKLVDTKTDCFLCCGERELKVSGLTPKLVFQCKDGNGKLHTHDDSVMCKDCAQEYISDRFKKSGPLGIMCPLDRNKNTIQDFCSDGLKSCFSQTVD